MSEGRRWLEQALAATPAPTVDRVTALNALAYILGTQGDAAGGVGMATQARELARRLGDPESEALATYHLGLAVLLADDLQRSVALLDEALKQLTAVYGEDNLHTVRARIVLGGALVLRGDMAGTIELCQRTADCCRVHGEQTYRGYALGLLARAEWARHNVAHADAYAREAVGLRRRMPDPRTLMVCGELLAYTAEAVGDLERAAVLLGATQELTRTFGLAGVRAVFGAPRQEAEERCRKALGDAAYEAALRRGSALSLDEIIRYALGEPT
jgi:non-specific serine/threonine protein kinase